MKSVDNEDIKLQCERFGWFVEEKRSEGVSAQGEDRFHLYPGDQNGDD